MCGIFGGELQKAVSFWGAWKKGGEGAGGTHFMLGGALLGPCLSLFVFSRVQGRPVLLLSIPSSSCLVPEFGENLPETQCVYSSLRARCVTPSLCFDWLFILLLFSQTRPWRRCTRRFDSLAVAVALGFRLSLSEALLSQLATPCKPSFGPRRGVTGDMCCGVGALQSYWHLLLSACGAGSARALRARAFRTAGSF